MSKFKSLKSLKSLAKKLRQEEWVAYCEHTREPGQYKCEFHCRPSQEWLDWKEDQRLKKLEAEVVSKSKTMLQKSIDSLLTGVFGKQHGEFIKALPDE